MRRLLFAAALIGAAGCASTNPNTAGDIGSVAGKAVSGVFAHAPVVGSVLDSVDEQRAKVGKWREGTRVARELERVQGMQWQQCATNPCLYGSTCAELFPEFLLPACSGPSAADAGTTPPPAAPADPEPTAAAPPVPAPAAPVQENGADVSRVQYQFPPRLTRAQQRRLAEQVDRGAEVCDPTLIGGSWRCQDGIYIWDPDLIYEWDGFNWTAPAGKSGD